MINDKYILDREIGTSRSRVYLAKHHAYETNFAIKILPKNSTEKEKNGFLREHEILKKLDHPNIIKAIEYGEIFKIDSKDYNQFDIRLGDKIIVEEYFDGKSLNNYTGKLKIGEIKSVLIDLLLVLHYLHQNNYIFHDLKPENILFSGGKIKLIDFGLAEHVKLFPNKNISGSLNYMAPEVLSNQVYSFNSDLYSLGVLLYKLIYGKNPYDLRENYNFAQDIFGSEIIFEKYEYFDNVIPVLKKLLEKNPEKRYLSALEVLNDLNYKLTEKEIKTFSNSSIYICNDELHDKIDHFFMDESTKMLIIQGGEGSGKSELLRYISENYDHAVLVEKDSINTKDFWAELIEKIIYKEDIFKILGEGIVDSLFNLLHSGEGEPFAIYRMILLKISERVKLKILFDDIHLYDDFLKESLAYFIPILQVNNVKIVGTEITENPGFSDKIENKYIISINPFSEEEVERYIDYSFADFFPKDDLLELVNKYSDANPGSINEIISNLLEFGCIRFDSKFPVIDKSNKNLSLLNINRKEIIRRRISELNSDEKSLLFKLSLLDINLSIDKVMCLTGCKSNDAGRILAKLEEKSLVKVDISKKKVIFLNEGDKGYIKSVITDTEEQIRKLIDSVINQNIDLEKIELARIYGYVNVERAVEIYLEVIKTNESKKNYLLCKQLYLNVLSLKIAPEVAANIRLKYALLLDTLGNFKDCYLETQKIRNEFLDKEDEFLLYFVRARALIRLSKPKLGLELLKFINKEIKDDILKSKVNLEIANVFFDLNSVNKAERIVLRIILEQNCNRKTLGEAYNILGLITIKKRREFLLGIKYLNRAKKIFEEGNLLQPLIGTEINLGIINSIIYKPTKAREHWENALKVNKSIGNLYQQGRLHSNFGTFYLRNFDLENSIKEYQEAKKISSTLGDRLMEGITYVNLGEVYHLNCEYSNSLEAYNKAENIFKKIKNNEEFGAVLLGKAKLFYELNNPAEVKKTINIYFEHLESDIEIEKNSLNLNLIKITYELLNGNNFIDENILKNIIETYGMNDDLMSYNFAHNLYVRLLILRNDDAKALIELNDPLFIDLASANPLFDAQRKYLLGIIARVNKNLGLDHHLNYLKESFNILENLSITELTWKVLLALCETYFERGNFSQLEKHAKYAKLLLKKITEGIREKDLRDTYIESLPVKSAIEKINFFMEKTNYV